LVGSLVRFDMLIVVVNGACKFVFFLGGGYSTNVHFPCSVSYQQQRMLTQYDASFAVNDINHQLLEAVRIRRSSHICSTFYINSTIPALDLYLGDTKIECGESGSSVSIVSGYGLHDRAIEVQSPAEARGFFL
jgi:hypothetical protein